MMVLLLVCSRIEGSCGGGGAWYRRGRTRTRPVMMVRILVCSRIGVMEVVSALVSAGADKDKARDDGKSLVYSR